MNGKENFGDDGIFIFYSIISGVFSSLGGFLGKLAGDYDFLISIGACYCAMVCCNSLGLIYFSKSLNSSSCSLQPTVLSTALNYLLSALYGYMFYNENLSLTWSFGTFLILLGILVMSSQHDYQKIKQK